MTWYARMMIRRCLSAAAVAGGLAWMAWDSYVLYQIMLAVSK